MEEEDEVGEEDVDAQHGPGRLQSLGGYDGDLAPDGEVDEGRKGEAVENTVEKGS